MQLEAMFNFYDEDKTGFVSFESTRCPLLPFSLWYFVRANAKSRRCVEEDEQYDEMRATSWIEGNSM